MNDLQKDLLRLAETKDLGQYSYRKLGKMLGGEHPYRVQHHLDQLLKHKKLVRNERTGSIIATHTESVAPHGLFLNIPVMGEANCGEATLIANNELQGFLKISPSLIKTKKTDKLFALRARGNSMNKASIGNQPILDNDYVLVYPMPWGEVADKDYVVSLIDDMANVKRIFLDYQNQRVILKSESLEYFEPIIIATEDLHTYQLIGKVVEVIEGTDNIDSVGKSWS